MSSVAIERKPCPRCGSSDNLIVFDDLHEHCFSANCDYHKNSSGHFMKREHTTTSNAVKNLRPINLLPIRLPKRRLLATTCSKYGMGVYDGQIHFPYYKNGTVVGYKVRNPRVPKKDSRHFYVKGSISNILFGNQCVHNKNIIAITSGEYDACSIFQMVNISAVSLHSDGAAKGTITENLEWLETFEKIILCIDNDESGDKTRSIIRDIIRPYQLYDMIFPTGYKDASDLLVDKQSELFSRAFWAARPVPVKTIFSKKSIEEQLLNNWDIPKGIMTGIPRLDDNLKGLRPGELTTVLAKAYQGKSTFCRIVLNNILARKEDKCLLISLEEQPVKYTRRLLHTYAGRPVIMLTKEEREFLVNDMLSYLIVSKLNGRVEPKELSDCIEYAIRKDGVKVVLIDNLSAAVDRSRLFEETSKLVETTFSLAKQFDVHIIIVCHIHRTKKTEGGESIESGYGSSAIEHHSDNIITISRPDKENNRTTISLVKNREIGDLVEFEIPFNTQTARYVYKGKESKKQQAGANHTRQLSSLENLIKI